MKIVYSICLVFICIFAKAQAPQYAWQGSAFTWIEKMMPYGEDKWLVVSREDDRCLLQMLDKDLKVLYSYGRDGYEYSSLSLLEVNEAGQILFSEHAHYCDLLFYPFFTLLDSTFQVLSETTYMDSFFVPCRSAGLLPNGNFYTVKGAMIYEILPDLTYIEHPILIDDNWESAATIYDPIRSEIIIRTHAVIYYVSYPSFEVVESYMFLSWNNPTVFQFKIDYQGNIYNFYDLQVTKMNRQGQTMPYFSNNEQKAHFSIQDSMIWYVDYWDQSKMHVIYPDNTTESYSINGPYRMTCIGVRKTDEALDVLLGVSQRYMDPSPTPVDLYAEINGNYHGAVFYLEDLPRIQYSDVSLDQVINDTSFVEYYFGHYIYLYDTKLEITNHSDTVLQSVVVNFQSADDKNCRIFGTFSVQKDSLNLAPNASMSIEVPWMGTEGDFDGTTRTINYCIWLTAPGHLMDEDQSNNHICNTVIVSTEEALPTYWSLGPIPADASIYLQTDGQTVDYQWVDMLGRSCGSGQTQGEQLSTTALPSGTYLLLLSQNKQLLARKKVVIQH